ncbi:MAG: DUF1894 domain-containing protein [Methanothrix sp.]|nr:DUF1894 domain-containing protein [Methanothrix sp.]
MGCIEALKPEVLLSRVSFKEARAFIEQSAPEVYYVDPGFKLLGEYMIGVPPLAIGIDDDQLIFPYTKPCHGTFVLRHSDAAEVERLRAFQRARFEEEFNRRRRERRQ